MNFTLKKAVVALIILFGGWQLALAAKLDDFTLKDLNNKRTSYAEIKGENLTVLNFWATWCKPCSREIPKLVDIYEALKDRGVQFIGINVDSPRNLPKVKPFANAHGITYPVLLDSNSELISLLQITAMPTILIVNKADEIVYLHRGYRPGDEEILMKEIEKLLAEDATDEDNENK